MRHSLAARPALPTWLCAAAVIFAAALAYHNSFQGPFVFDDESSIVTNASIRQLWPITAPLTPPGSSVTVQGRPLLNLSLALNYAIGGTAVQGYHAGNWLIHVGAALALFGAVRRTLLLPRLQAALRAPAHATLFALAVAVLWVVHPLQTESVTYIIQRAESLVGLCYLLTIYGFIRAFERSEPGARGHAGWLAASVGLCALGMTAKEVMATAPLMILFYDRTFVAGTFLGALRLRGVFYSALAVTWLLLLWLIAQTGWDRGGSVGFGVGIGWVDYWLTQFKAVAHYGWLTVWPHPLVFEYGSFWIRHFSEIAVPVLLVFGVLVATLVALWRRSALGFLGAWFFGILAPTSLTPGTTQMIVEHRMYLPLAALLVGAVALAYRFMPRRSALLPSVIGAVAVASIALTIRRNADYRSDVTLWKDTIAKAPRNPLAHFMLASALERAGHIPDAIASYERTLELKPDFSIGHENYGQLLLKQGRRKEAIGHFESALRLQPEYPDAHANLGNAYLAEGLIAEAVGHLEKAAQLTPTFPVARYNFGNALAAAGLQGEAVAEYEAAIKLDPRMAEAHFNLANALGQLERGPEAITHYEAALRLRPEYPSAHYNLANALAASGRQQEAIAHYQAALRSRPDYVEAHHNLGSALFELGQWTESARHYEEALRLAPDFPHARENLLRARAQAAAK